MKKHPEVDPYFSYNMALLVGCNAHVTTLNNIKYEGVFASFSSPSSELMLEAAHMVEDDGEDVVITKHFDVLIIPSEKVLTIKFENVDMSYATREFATDSAIASARGVSVGEKELTPWDGADDMTPDLELNSISGSSNGWEAQEMFKKNEEKYGITSSFSSDLSGYTTKLDKTDIHEFKKHEEVANQIAQEIEGTSTSWDRAKVENGDEDDEEEAFSAVVRTRTNNNSSNHLNSNVTPSATSTGDGKYIPPSRRSNAPQHQHQQQQQQASNNNNNNNNKNLHNVGGPSTLGQTHPSLNNGPPPHLTGPPRKSIHSGGGNNQNNNPRNYGGGPNPGNMYHDRRYDSRRGPPQNQYSNNNHSSSHGGRMDDGGCRQQQPQQQQQQQRVDSRNKQAGGAGGIDRSGDRRGARENEAAKLKEFGTSFKLQTPSGQDSNQQQNRRLPSSSHGGQPHQHQPHQQQNPNYHHSHSQPPHPHTPHNIPIQQQHVPNNVPNNPMLSRTSPPSNIGSPLINHPPLGGKPLNNRKDDFVPPSNIPPLIHQASNNLSSTTISSAINESNTGVSSIGTVNSSQILSTVNNSNINTPATTAPQQQQIPPSEGVSSSSSSLSGDKESGDKSKFTFNPNAKEFNPTAKSFAPVNRSPNTPPRPPSTPANNPTQIIPASMSSHSGQYMPNMPGMQPTLVFAPPSFQHAQQQQSSLASNSNVSSVTTSRHSGHSGNHRKGGGGQGGMLGVSPNMSEMTPMTPSMQMSANGPPLLASASLQPGGQPQYAFMPHGAYPPQAQVQPQSPSSSSLYVMRVLPQGLMPMFQQQPEGGGASQMHPHMQYIHNGTPQNNPNAQGHQVSNTPHSSGPSSVIQANSFAAGSHGGHPMGYPSFIPVNVGYQHGPPHHHMLTTLQPYPVPQGGSVLPHSQ